MGLNKLANANFMSTPRKAGEKPEMVPWLDSEEKFPSGSFNPKSRRYGINPKLIIAILDEAGAGESKLRSVAQDAIDTAEQFNNKNKPTPTVPSDEKYFFSRKVNGNWQLVSGQPQTLADVKGEINEDWMFVKVGQKEWASVKSLMTFVAPPPPPAAPSLPPTPVDSSDDTEPEYEDTSDDEINLDEAEDMAEKLKQRLLAKS